MKNILEKAIREVPNFPKPGVTFKDITPLMQDHWPALIQSMGENIPWNDIDYVLGVESRGFILGAALATQYKKGFIPVRKKGKLPPPVIAQSYELEYGSDTLEMAVNSHKARVLIVDDVLATGGTLRAVMKMCENNQFEVKAMSVFINLSFLNTFKEEGLPLYPVLSY